MQSFDAIELGFLSSLIRAFEANADWFTAISDRKEFLQLSDTSKANIAGTVLLLTFFCRKHGLVESEALATRLQQAWFPSFPAELQAWAMSQRDPKNFGEPAPSWERSELKFPDISQHEIRFRLRDLHALVESEMKKQLFFWISDDMGKYYKKERPMGDAVYAAFERSRFDVTEACLSISWNCCSKDFRRKLHAADLVATTGIRSLSGALLTKF